MDTSSLTPEEAEQESGLDAELRSSLAGLRASLSEVFSAVGANLKVPHSISREFGVDKSLAWKLARVIREPNPYAAALDVPGEEAMRIFSRAMRSAGASRVALDSLCEAVDAFQLVIRKHCGDRATLEMIASAATTQTSRQQQEAFRRHLFRGSSAVFGIQTRVHVSSHFIAPNHERPQLLDTAIVAGLVDLRRIRSDVAWAIATIRTFGDDGSPRAMGALEPIDSAGLDAGGAPLMREFCSTPVPELRAVPGPNSSLRFELPEGPVGSAHAVTLYTGSVHRAEVSRFQTPHDRFGECCVILSTPAELVLLDLFVHHDLAFARNPSPYLYSQLPGGVSYPNGPRDRGLLTLAETIQDLGDGPPRSATPDVPEYARLTQSVFTKLGYRAEEFFGMRIQVRFPPIPAMLLYRFELPPAP